jgi:hypothetical protein
VQVWYNDIARLLISVGCNAFEACLHATVHTSGGPCGYFFIAILPSLILYSMLSDPDIAAYGTIYMDLIENNLKKLSRWVNNAMRFSLREEN